MWKLVSKKPRIFEYTIYNLYSSNYIIASGFRKENEIQELMNKFKEDYKDNPQVEIKFNEVMELDWEEQL